MLMAPSKTDINDKVDVGWNNCMKFDVIHGDFEDKINKLCKDLDDENSVNVAS